MEGNAFLFCHPGKHLAQVGVRCDTSRDHKSAHIRVRIDSEGDFLRDSLAHLVGVTRGKEGAVKWQSFLLIAVQKIDCRRLKSREGEVERTIIQCRGGKDKIASTVELCLLICKVEAFCLSCRADKSFLGKSVKALTRRVRNINHASDFVEGFADSIITRLTDYLVVGVGVHAIDGGMSSREGEGEKRGLRRRFGIEICRGDMSFDVVDGDQGNAVCHRERFCEVHRDKQSADQSRVRRYGDEVNVGEGIAAFAERLVGQGADGINVRA